MRFYPVCFDSVTSYVTPHGSRIHQHYEPRFDGERTILVVSGTSDIQDAINSFAPFCDMEYMLSRLKLGDTSVLSRKQPIFGDFSSLPSNPADVLNIVHSAESRFGQLSFEEKQNYNNDFRVWLSRMLSDDVRPNDSPSPVSGPSQDNDVKE